MTLLREVLCSLDDAEYQTAYRPIAAVIAALVFGALFLLASLVGVAPR